MNKTREKIREKTTRQEIGRSQKERRKEKKIQ